MRNTITLALSLTCLLALSYASAADNKVYKWKDAKGLVHYSERPPSDVQSELVNPNTGHSDPVDYGVGDAETAPEAKAGANKSTATKNEPPKFKDKERCDLAHKNLDMLSTYTRIKIQDENGEYRFITPDEQKQKTAEATKAIEESCD